MEEGGGDMRGIHHVILDRLSVRPHSLENLWETCDANQTMSLKSFGKRMGELVASGDVDRYFNQRDYQLYRLNEGGEAYKLHKAFKEEWFKRPPSFGSLTGNELDLALSGLNKIAGYFRRTADSIKAAIRK